jgi:hypothetical protein
LNLKDSLLENGEHFGFLKLFDSGVGHGALSQEILLSVPPPGTKWVARTNLFVRGWGKHGQASLVRGTAGKRDPHAWCLRCFSKSQRVTKFKIGLASVYDPREKIAEGRNELLIVSADKFLERVKRKL